MALSLLTQIISDLAEPISYLPYGIIIGTIYLLARRIVKIAKNESIKESKHDYVLAFIFVYMTVLWILAFFSRESGSRVGVDLQLFSVLGTSIGETASYIENILLFIPLSVLLYMAYPIFKTPVVNIGFAFGFSVFLEAMQLITSKGYCQLDDVVANTLGAVLGMIILSIWKSVFYNENALYIVQPIQSYSSKEFF